MEVLMEVLYERCFGLDVHKSSITACVLLDPGHKPQSIFRGLVVQLGTSLILFDG